MLVDMITRLHHVATVVPTLEVGMEIWRDGLGIPVSIEATVVEQGVRAALMPCGDGEIELLEPLDEGGSIAKFLERGGGIHHICFESDDVVAELKRIADSGVRMIDTTPRCGLAGRIGFLHPKSTLSTLVEIATPGGGVDARPYPEPNPPGDAPFRTAGWTNVVFAVGDVDVAESVFVKNFAFDRCAGTVELPELGAVAKRFELPNVTIDLAAVAGDGWLSGRVEARGYGAALLGLEVEDLEPGAELLVEEGATVRFDKTADGAPVAIVDGIATGGIDLMLRQMG